MEGEYLTTTQALLSKFYKFIIHQSPYHPTAYSVNNDVGNKTKKTDYERLSAHA
jgi:hypothetical protein